MSNGSEGTYVGGVDLGDTLPPQDGLDLGDTLPHVQGSTFDASLEDPLQHDSLFGSESVAPSVDGAGGGGGLGTGSAVAESEGAPSFLDESDYDAEEMRTVWDVLDCEAMDRGVVEVECFVFLARVARAAQRGVAELRVLQNAYLAEQRDALAAALEGLQVQEREKRHGLQAQEHSAYTALRGMLEPLKEDIVERVDTRLRRMRRRDRKIEELKHLHIAESYKQEADASAAKRSADGAWNAFVHKLYIGEAAKLQHVARAELESKYAAGEAAVAFNSPGVVTPAKRAAAPPTPSPARRTLHEELLRLQTDGLPERVMSTGLRAPQRAPAAAPRETWSGAVPVTSPSRRGGAVGGDKELKPIKHSYTPFAAFGPAPAGPFSPREVYDKMG